MYIVCVALGQLFPEVVYIVARYLEHKRMSRCTQAVPLMATRSEVSVYKNSVPCVHKQAKEIKTP